MAWVTTRAPEKESLQGRQVEKICRENVLRPIRMPTCARKKIYTENLIKNIRIEIGDAVRWNIPACIGSCFRWGWRDTRWRRPDRNFRWWRAQSDAARERSTTSGRRCRRGRVCGWTTNCRRSPAVLWLHSSSAVQSKSQHSYYRLQ